MEFLANVLHILSLLQCLLFNKWHFINDVYSAQIVIFIVYAVVRTS